MTTVWVFLDYAAKKNHDVHQMDIHNTFLYGDLHEEVYMKTSGLPARSAGFIYFIF